jgi:thioredoxin-like negative regulator of GroEL
VLGDAPAATPPRSSDRPSRVPAPDAPPAPATRDPAGGSAAEIDPALAGPKLDAVMDEANKAYDRGDFEDAKTIAGRLLAKLPTNVRMLRIMVSASCIDGDSAVAQAHYAKLPPADQEQMRVRCARYGIAFPDRP